MAEEKDRLRVSAGGFPRTEAGFERIAVVRLPVKFDAATELFKVRGSKGDARVDRGFHVGGRLNLNEFSGEIEERLLFAARPGQQGAHGKGGLCRGWHVGSCSPRSRNAAFGRLSDSTPLTII